MPDANVGDNGPRLRVGRRVDRHVYLTFHPEPSDDDTPLVTMPSADLARWLVAAVAWAEALTAMNDAGEDMSAALPALDAAMEAEQAYRAAREVIR